MVANAHVLADSDEIEHAARLLAKKFAQWAQLSPADKKAVRFVKVVPKIISILDYTKGFGRTDLVRARTPRLSAAVLSRTSGRMLRPA